MTKAPLISVIVPVYNVAKLLERCVDSVLAQTVQDFELILIDDGSTDMSGKFCDVYAKRDRRIHVIHQPNAGLSAARNAGLRLAKGKYITFIDSDDAVLPDMLEFLLRPCEEQGIKLSICRRQAVIPSEFATAPATAPLDNLSSQSSSYQQDFEIVKPKDCLIAMLLEQDFSLTACGCLYAREIFHGIHFPEGRLYEDVGTTYKAALACNEIAMSRTAKYLYYQNPDTITSGRFTLRKLDLIDLTDQMCRDISDWARTLPDSDQSDLRQVANLRRMHARFSILRQYVMLETPTRDEKLAMKPLIKFLKRHRHEYIEQNPFASSRDRLAMLSLRFGLPMFKFAWKIYSSHKHSR